MVASPALIIPAPASQATTVAQHNALVNARFSFGPVESRLFLLMLARLDRSSSEFSACCVPIRELTGPGKSNNSYALVRKAVERFGQRSIVVEKLEASGRRTRKPDFAVRPLLKEALYVGEEGVVVACFNEVIRPYLLDLRDNFTQAQLAELLKLENPHSARIY